MKNSEALTAITCSTVNSYNGLVPRVGGLKGNCNLGTNKYNLWTQQ
ncbi:MAG: hypothetical protein Ct9H300mP5_1170 [Candidatus Pelagibacterales bacterium]|nr:MAG: hypothetical protein Ct9H300mP5_1170 [Pelagibacterales bacterium]